MKTLYLTRHAKTLFNMQHKIQGFCDSPLTKEGILQTKEARRHIDQLGIKFDDAYCSTSERASDTVEILTDIPYTRCKNLREWNFGSLEGEGEYLNPPLPYNDFFVQFGGESQKQVEHRISNAIMSIMKKTKGKNVLIVSHGGAIANFYRHWENNSSIKRDGPIQNCSLLEYDFDGQQFKLKRIIKHDYSKIKA